MNLEFEGKIALVYDRSLEVLGGGQREVFAFAKALSILGFDAEVVTSTPPVPTATRIREAFGDEFAAVPVRCVEGPVDEMLRCEQPDLFFNQSHMHIIRNPAPVGIYRQMFPVRRVWRENSPDVVKLLGSYSLILSNSSFTKRYSDLYWDFPQERSRVILPPLAAQAATLAKRFLIEPPVKEKRFFCLGRFAEAKRQRLVMDAFLEARSRYSVLRDWELTVLGVRHHDPAARAYFADCERVAERSGGSIRIEADLPYDRLEEHMVRSFGFVHAMGAFELPGEQPHLCEHFGLCTVEAMAHGCIPLVYARSGVFDVLDVDRGGVPFISHEGLVEGYEEVARLWQAPETAGIQRAMIEMALRVEFDRFIERLREILMQEPPL